MDLIEAIARAAQESPNRIAHISSDRLLPYRELAKRSDALAAYLLERYPGDRSAIAVIGHKEPEMLIGFLGAVKSGHPYVPIDLSIPARRANRIVESSRAVLTLTPATIAELSNDSRPAKLAWLDQDDPFYIIYTSGSTGDPKGVVITLRCLTAFLEWMLDEQRLTRAGEVFLNQAPFSFDLSVMDLYLSLATAGTLFSIGSEEIGNPKRLYAGLERSSIKTWVSTPTFARMCLVERGFTQTMLPEVRRFLFCGETLATETASKLVDRFPNATIWNTYGPTEATVACTSVQITRELLAKYSPLPVGKPMKGTKVLVMNAAQQPVQTGERGEIVITGANVSAGYLGQPELTDRVFSGSPGSEPIGPAIGGGCRMDCSFSKDEWMNKSRSTATGSSSATLKKICERSQQLLTLWLCRSSKAASRNQLLPVP
jgi:D-alanine--poly(phosphoribitol) ligase subunit 1